MTDLILTRLLVAEADFAEILKNTRAAKQLQGARDDLLEHVRKIGSSGDLPSIVATEQAIVKGDLTRYANSADMKKSLTTALTEIGVIERHMAMVADPARYRIVNEAHSLPRNRKRDLPYDEARQAFNSHYTRLTNLDKSRLTAEEKNVIEARRGNLKTGAKLYEQMQARAIGISSQA